MTVEIERTIFIAVSDVEDELEAAGFRAWRDGSHSGFCRFYDPDAKKGARHAYCEVRQVVEPDDAPDVYETCNASKPGQGASAVFGRSFASAVDKIVAKMIDEKRNASDDDGYY